MTLYVLGAGSIGLLYASHMQKVSNKHRVVLLLRSKNKEKLIRIIENGRECFLARSMLKDANGKIYVSDIPSKIIGEESEQNIQSILLTTKAFQAVEAFKSIVPRIDPSLRTNLILMTNGCLGVSSAIQEALKMHRIETVNIVHATCTHGAGPIYDYHHDNNLDTNFNVMHTGIGRTFLEESSISDEISRIWSSCGLECSVLSPSEMYIMNWKKLAANCVINPLTALRKCPNGELFDDVLIKEEINQSELHYNNSNIAHKILKEVSTVALAHSRNHPNISQDNLDSLKFDELLAFVRRVVSDTALNKSSMLLDVLNNRETEIDYLNGYVVNVGVNSHIDVEANQYIISEIRKS